MALIVETGSNVVGAESYLSVSDADTYHANRGNAAWAALTTTETEQALRKATDYMQTYRKRWKGYRSYATQPLDWPRRTILIDDSVLNSWIPYDSIPTEIKNACAELALRAAAGELAPDLERAVASETVGPISTTYVQGAPQYTQYRAIDMMLRPLLKNGGNGVSLVRA